MCLCVCCVDEIFLLYLSIYISIYLSIYLSTYLSIYLSIHRRHRRDYWHRGSDDAKHTDNTRLEIARKWKRARGHATPRHANPEDFSASRTLASEGTTSHTPTQLRLASPARSHARTNETNTISRLDSQSRPPIYIYLYYIYMYILLKLEGV